VSIDKYFGEINLNFETIPYIIERVNW